MVPAVTSGTGTAMCVRSPVAPQLGKVRGSCAPLPFDLANEDSNENTDYELGEMTLSKYNSYENAEYDCGEMTLSNYDSNKNADYDPSESEDRDGQIYILISHI